MLGHNKLSSQTPTITAGAYTANDAIGGMLTFQVGSKDPDQGGVIMAVIIIDTAKQTPLLNLVLFNDTFTATADNGVFAPTDQNLQALAIGHIPVQAQHWASFSTNAMATVPYVLPFNANTTGKLYGQLQELSGKTYTKTNNLTVKLVVMLNG